jgi:hypothetical protein
MSTAELFVNTPHQAVTLNGGIATAPAAGTVETWAVTIAAATGTQFALPALTGGQLRLVTETAEIILATAGSTAAGNQSWTVTRGADNTTPTTHSSGAALTAKVTASSLTGSTRAVAPYIYAPDGWDAGWKAAKAAAGSTPAQLLFLGDSVQVGQFCSDWKKSYVHLTRESLKAGLGGLHADFFPAWGLSAISAAGPIPGTPPWSVVNAGATDSGRQLGLSWLGVSYDNNATNPTPYYQQTFTSPDACTAMELYYLDYNSGTFKFSIDGGADQTVTCTNAGVAATSNTKRVQITGLASATHTLAVGKQTAAALCIPIGVATYPTGLTGGGLSIARFCAGLANLSNDWIVATQQPPKRLELYAGQNPNNNTNTTYTYGYPTQPHCTIVELGLNDCNQGATQANWEIALRRLIQGLRAGRSKASILFHLTCNPDTDISDNTAGFVPANWPVFTSSVYKFAQLYNCAILNTHAKWGENPVGAGLMSVAANVHPLDAGHQDIANDLLSIL